MTALRNELIEKFQQDEVDVSTDSRWLGITFTNSSFNNLGAKEKAAKAFEIALFAKEHYRSISSIEKIGVSFVLAKSFLVFHENTAMGAYLFDKAILTAAGLPGNLPPPGDAVATFNSTPNQTIVYLRKNIELYSDARSNVMLLPQVYIEADKVRPPNKGALPELAKLEFTTYSERRMFSGDPKLEINVDGQPVFSGKAKLTKVIGSDAEKSVNEFLSQEITYQQFVRLTDGKNVQIILRARKFELTGEDIQSLRSIRTYIESATTDF